MRSVPTSEYARIVVDGAGLVGTSDYAVITTNASENALSSSFDYGRASAGFVDIDTLEKEFAANADRTVLAQLGKDDR